MSISGSLANALSGLTASARAAEIVSSNVSNALTEGYGRRELELSAASASAGNGGVQVVGVTRNVNQQVVGERRAADAEVGLNAIQTDYLVKMQNLVGTPDAAGALTTKIANLEVTLIEAASLPDSATRLAGVLSAATALAEQLNTASQGVQALRMNADREISQQVDSLNAGLTRIEKLNSDITVLQSAGLDISALIDQRQQEIDKIASIVPLTEVPRNGGQIALYTPGGAILLDGRAATIGFDPVGVIVPQMTLGSGALSGLTLNGQAMLATADGSLAGGSLSGLFQVRDEIATTVQTQLDALSRDLIERFSNATADTTLTSGDPGIFTDAGLAFDPLTETGLAGRISINAIADPAVGGDLNKLRDGLGSIVPGDAGDASGLIGLLNALTETRIPASAVITTSARSVSALAGDFISLINQNLSSAQADQSFSLAQADILKVAELQGGVDTDYEMQRLLLIEQSYAANARVISTIDDLIQTLLGI